MAHSPINASPAERPDLTLEDLQSELDTRTRERDETLRKCVALAGIVKGWQDRTEAAEASLTAIKSRIDVEGMARIVEPWAPTSLQAIIKAQALRTLILGEEVEEQSRSSASLPSVVASDARTETPGDLDWAASLMTLGRPQPPYEAFFDMDPDDVILNHSGVRVTVGDVRALQRFLTSSGGQRTDRVAEIMRAWPKGTAQ